MRLFKYLFLWLIGGLIYYSIEILWRGYSHPSMMMLGGICFVVVGSLNNYFTWERALISQMVISAVVITVLELITGLIVNKYLNWGVWDYSQMPYNFMGQICLLYTNLWFLLSLVAILLDDYIRYWLLREEKPRYNIL